MPRFLPALGGLLLAAVAAHADDAAAPALANPQMSLVLNGIYYADDIHGAGYDKLAAAAGVLVPAPGGDAGLAEGFNLGESEVSLSSTVDPYLDAYAILTFATDSVGVEEAAFTTRALPAGWQLKVGKFKSGFGYQNSRHAHAWDFVDQNLPYATLVGAEGLSDTGVQATWLPPLDTYTQLGAEVLQGDQERFGAAVDLDAIAASLAVNADTLPGHRHGPQLFTAFVKVAPDLGTGGALQLGASVALHRGEQEMQETSPGVLYYAGGDATLLGLEAVWKRSPTSGYGRGGARVQAEYLYLDKHLDILFDNTPAANTGKSITGTQDGFYVQGVYGFAARWEAGLRYDVTGLTNKTDVAGTPGSLDATSRVSAEATFRPSEFSYFRLQLADTDAVDATGTRNRYAQLLLQYNLSLGAHGAHAF